MKIIVLRNMSLMRIGIRMQFRSMDSLKIAAGGYRAGTDGKLSRENFGWKIAKTTQNLWKTIY